MYITAPIQIAFRVPPVASALAGFFLLVVAESLVSFYRAYQPQAVVKIYNYLWTASRL